jgi:hypothetical protein
MKNELFETIMILKLLKMPVLNDLYCTLCIEVQFGYNLELLQLYDGILSIEQIKIIKKVFRSKSVMIRYLYLSVDLLYILTVWLEISFENI